MKEWNFTFRPKGGGDWGWNSVWARGKKSAIKKATKWVKDYDTNYALDIESVNCNKATYDMLMSTFW